MPLKVVDFHFPDGTRPYVVSSVPGIGETVDDRGEWMVASVAFDLNGSTAVMLRPAPSPVQAGGSGVPRGFEELEGWDARAGSDGSIQLERRRSG